MAETTGDIFRSYVRSLRWQVPLTLVVVVGMWAFDIGGIREYGLGPVLLVGIGLLFVLGPLLWLRFEAYGRHDRPFWIFLGLALVWLAVSTLLVLGVTALVVGD